MYIYEAIANYSTKLCLHALDHKVVTESMYIMQKERYTQCITRVLHMLYSPACVYGINTHAIPLSITSFLHGGRSFSTAVCYHASVNDIRCYSYSY